MEQDYKGYGREWKYKKVTKIVFAILIAFIIVKMLSGGYNRADAQKDTIVVSGKGEIVTKPDLATVSFSVMEENIDVSKASDAVNTKIAKMTESLKTNGVDEKDIKTTGYNINPRYDYVNSATYPYGGRQVLAGYDVTQSIEVKIRDLSKAGKVITDLGSLGATNLYGPNFTNDNYDELVKQARDAAIADAKTEAKRLSKALGVRLVKIVAFSENGNYPIPYGMGGGYGGPTLMKDSAVPAVLPTGENKITSNVSITYEIR